MEITRETQDRRKVIAMSAAALLVVGTAGIFIGRSMTDGPSAPAAENKAAFEGLPGVSDLVAEDGTLRMRVSGPITHVVKAAARHELVDFVSREPSLEETFLAEYATPGGSETGR